MTSPNLVARNRLNSLLSTGPITPAGKLRCSLNALRHGLEAAKLVLPALGETPEGLASFRESVLGDLRPDGCVETELANRVVELMWRTRRVALAEVAAASKVLLPTDPATITGDGVDPLLPMPVDAPLALRLGRVRALLLTDRAERERLRLASEALVSRFLNLAVPQGVAFTVLRVAGGLLGWSAFAHPDPWLAIVRNLDQNVKDVCLVQWTVAFLRRVLDSAAKTANRTAKWFRKRVRSNLRTESVELGQRISQRESEESELVAQMQGERARAAAVAVYGDDAMVTRIIRAEGHLGRELERTLGLLARLQAGRMGRRAEERDWSVVGLRVLDGSLCS